MASLTNTKIKDTYDGLLKTTDNDALGGTYKLITDGLGNSSGLYLGTGGRVGINQSNPSDNLEVNGAIRIADQYELKFGGTTASIFGSSSLNQLRFYTNNSERLRIDSSGNVGINTQTSDGKLTIARTGFARGVASGISLKDQNGTTRGGFGTDGTVDNFLQVLASNGIKFHTTNTDGSANERMRIDSSGRVGIGVVPTEKLDIEGASPFIRLSNTDETESGIVFVDSASAAQSAKITYDSGSSNSLKFYNNAATERMRIDSSGNVRLSGTAPSAEDTISKIDFYNNSSSINLAGIEGKRTAGGTNYGSLIFNTTNSGTSSEKMRIDSSGNVGINNQTLVPSKLSVSAGNVSTFGSWADTAIAIDNYSSAGTISQIGFGYFGAGTSNAAAAIALLATTSSGNSYGDLIFGTRNVTSDTAPTEKMRITSGGDVLIGTTGTPNGTSVFGAAFIDSSSGRNILYSASSTTSGSGLCQFYNPNGLVGQIQVSGSSTNYVTSSDYRLKENVVDMQGALDRVDQLEPKRFNFISDAETTVDGFIAHEVQDIVPEAVTGEKDAVDYEGNPQYQGIDQSKIVPLLVGAIKELKAEIETFQGFLIQSLPSQPLPIVRNLSRQAMRQLETY